MIGKLIKGSGSRGLINYLLADRDHNGDDRPRVEIIGGTLTGRDTRSLAAEFGQLHRLRPGLGQHVAHQSLRLHPDDPRLTDAEWSDLASQWADGMGFEAFVVVGHGDDHVHVAASRIRLDGSVVSDTHDFRRSEALVRQLEVRFGLIRVEASHLLEPERTEGHRKAPTMARIALSEKGIAVPSEQVADIIDATLSRSVTVTEFISTLEAAGIEVRPNLASTGKLSGFAYSLDGTVLTAKALGRGYTLRNLVKKGLDYEQDRDLPALTAARQRAADGQLERTDDHSDSTAPGSAGADGGVGRRAGELGRGLDATRGSAGQADRGDGGNAPSGRSAGQEGAPGGLERSKELHGASHGGGESSAIPASPAGSGGGAPGGDNSGTATAAPESVATGNNIRGDGDSGGDGVSVAGGTAVAEIRPAKAAADIKGAIWRTAYGADLDERLKAHLRFVDRQAAAVYLHDGSVVRDLGNRITTSRSTPAAIDIMIAEAKAKGWTSVEFTGSDEFKKAAAVAAIAAGLDVSNPELADIVAAEKAKLAEAKLTPGPSVQELRDIAALPPGGKTEAAVRQQLAALGVGRFEVGVIPYRGAPKEMKPHRTRTFDAETAVKSLGWLRRQNQAGYDIYIRPAPLDDDRCHPLIFIDDITAEALGRMRTDGYEPALVVESSPRNFQAWVRIGTEPIGRDEATEVARQLAKRYGGDPGAADWRHYSRLSGFTNRKPSRLQSSGLPPFCRLHSADGVTATKGAEFLTWIRAAMFERQQQEERVAARARQLQRDQAQFRRPDGLKDAVSSFLEIRQRIATTKPDGSPDESRRDFGAAVRLLEHYHPDQIAAALRNSPDIAKRKRNIEEYIRRTIEAAEREYERQQQARAAQAVAYRPRPRPAPGREVRR
ncbi:DNA-primase RepB domain-containing protein [Thalassobaculum sp. OXR-137]|uniref:DNA-primase RepB domain-containing protein n=1 Tax=Thalassobaculum sp. OXR-137 TaxID=3100173 RepID=UPI002AC8BAAD|nr:DNA-primase RepB domain-containing protein [Thalassobaculum sp. OXR-137]WPZ35527.1 DNA-primase RepB domain-containing protein [Thalassobaculum sp. OXR-137]